MSELVSTGFSREDVDLIKNTVAKGATDNELKLFLHRCKNMGLDPLKPGQVHFIKYGNSPGSIVVGIEGFRSKAMSTGKHKGTKRGVIRDDHGRVTGAFCEVYREDWTHPAVEEVSLAEYSTGKAMWAKMPETMIKKVAEAAALRMAFPDELGGMYSAEEMDQASVETAPPPRTVNQPRPPPAIASAPEEATDQRLFVTKDQIDQILALASTNSIQTGELTLYCQTAYGKSGKDLTFEEADRVIGFLADEEMTSAKLMAEVVRLQKPKPPADISSPSNEGAKTELPNTQASVAQSNKAPPVNHAPGAAKPSPTPAPAAPPTPVEKPKAPEPPATALAGPEAVQTLWNEGMAEGFSQADMDAIVLRCSGKTNWDILTNAQVRAVRVAMAKHLSTMAKDRV